MEQALSKPKIVQIYRYIYMPSLNQNKREQLMAFEKMKYIKNTPEECLFQAIVCLETETILVSAIVAYDTIEL